MTKEVILAQKKNRLATRENNRKNVKCPGVIKKLKREIRNMEL